MLHYMAKGEYLPGTIQTHEPFKMKKFSPASGRRKSQRFEAWEEFSTRKTSIAEIEKAFDKEL